MWRVIASECSKQLKIKDIKEKNYNRSNTKSIDWISMCIRWTSVLHYTAVLQGKVTKYSAVAVAAVLQHCCGAVEATCELHILLLLLNVFHFYNFLFPLFFFVFIYCRSTAAVVALAVAFYLCCCCNLFQAACLLL